MRRDADLREVFQRKMQITLQISLTYAEVTFAVQALKLIDTEFGENIFEFTTVTPGGLDWYREQGITRQDVTDCRNILEQLIA